ncbi:hypothetical protein CXF83_13595 [Shewanella sp. Choline-02u-19]|uniref:hypothetical protein n=1 Tax=unclassified Shewanella TaxID=196818 RepID=UPI000C33DCC0|nr:MULTISPECIES: hypothetical protein [unclassified Shewanella]PKG58348.1 hypothetical protein CXF82_04900 [Shewanella sp. GutDb-MelDb]PKH56865.1 hypothetical protein CXF84_10305 [Shewanella sp. Bg11-22]PKI27662.1 hypothetical protein CXF83_13595 [Shewanella sp. Choline-02u-19]
MANLADVSFRAKTADNTQKAYRPSGITCFFSTDTALDYYAYSTRREDAAMLFEEHDELLTFNTTRRCSD